MIFPSLITRRTPWGTSVNIRFFVWKWNCHTPLLDIKWTYKLFVCDDIVPLCVWTGAEVAVLCITKSGEVVNYQAYTNRNGVYVVAETMPESERWDACLARPISSFHSDCTHVGDGSTGVKFSYNHPSGHFHTLTPFVYRPPTLPTYCM